MSIDRDPAAMAYGRHSAATVAEPAVGHGRHRAHADSAPYGVSAESAFERTMREIQRDFERFGLPSHSDPAAIH